MALMQEFKEFAVKGNVIDLAVAVVIGGAFNKIVTALVDDIIMPLANFMVPSGDWREASVSPLHIKVGHFAGSVVDFAIVAAVLFIIVVKLLGKKKPAEPPAA